ncbi:MAG: Flagellar assembly factor FliW [Planctomycetes bacterium ADurb.Bin412]|nr:MAG: Flagellar assembly factor FliW [Planctomycetes bacterium ADurb.Bin412]
MKVKTTRFGEIETEFDRVIRFPRGILGFPEYREYVLLQTNEEGTFFWLQSTENPALAFVVSDPMLFVPEYQVPLKMEEFADIALARLEDAQIFIIVNKVEQVLTGNLQGPLVINAKNRQGLQLVLSEKKYSTRHSLVRLEQHPKQVSKIA